MSMSHMGGTTGDGLPANILLKSLESIVITTSALTGGWPCPALPASFFRSKNQMPACSPDMGIKKKENHMTHPQDVQIWTQPSPAVTWQVKLINALRWLDHVFIDDSPDDVKRAFYWSTGGPSGCWWRFEGGGRTWKQADHMGGLFMFK